MRRDRSGSPGKNTPVKSHGSEATCKKARIGLDTDMAGLADAFNPAEMLLARLADCILKRGRARHSPAELRSSRNPSFAARVRQDTPPKMVRIDYEIVLYTDETHARLHLLIRNLQKYGTIMNTLADATELVGTIRRKTG